MTWLSGILAIAQTGTLVAFVLWVTNGIKQYTALVQELAQAKLDLAQRSADLAQAQLRGDAARQLLNDRLVRDYEIVKGQVTGAGASQLADLLARVLEGDAGNPDIARAVRQRAPTEPMQADGKADEPVTTPDA